MSTRGDDAVLSDAEREAFARLQAQAIAEDRSFGPSRAWRAGAVAQAVGRHLSGVVTTAWFGPAVMVLGVIAVVAGIAWTLPIAVVGLLFVAGGAIPVVERLRHRIDRALADRSSS